VISGVCWNFKNY